MTLSAVILAFYFGVLGLLALYGLHRAYLLVLLARHRRHVSPAPPLPDDLPFLTVQIPLYNELHVARRVIAACAALDWPRDRFEIQVLDDSDDETGSVVADAVARHAGAGIDVHHIRRADRSGYKAGALAAGLQAARGELVAVFDADFAPSPDFARRLTPLFADPTIGMVQARWGHLNRRASLLTRAQSVLLDGHFGVEHAARYRSGRFFNFNGTAGIWRRRCIEDAGGWQHDTLTEDLDLSYRAQLRGWRFAFVEGAVAPAELPVEMGAFKSQQHRWAQGSIQTARKMLPSILKARLPLGVKVESIVHLTANVSYVLMVALALLMGPAAWLRRGQGLGPLLFLDLPLLALSLASIAAFYVVAERRAAGSPGEGLRMLPMVMAVGIGLSFNNARAVVQGFRRRPAEFRRTPKYGLAGLDDAALATCRYRARRNVDTWIELAAGLYLAAWTVVAATCGLWGTTPFLILFAAGFLFTSGLTLLQERVRPTA